MRVRISAAVSALALLAGSDAGLGAPNRMAELMARARAEAPTQASRVATSSADTPQGGLANNRTLNVDAYAFQGAQSAGDQFGDDGNGYRYLEASTSGGYMAAPVQIPSGAMIDAIGVSYCAGATGDLTIALFDGQVFGQPISLIGSLTTINVGNCFVQTNAVPGGGYLYAENTDHPLYAVIHWEGPMDGTLKFNDVSVLYHLVVSPAPQIPTFADVPTNHPFFQFVEALAASGITAGCGNGNFCPEQPLTRGQMAVFLSKGLGLNWPN